MFYIQVEHQNLLWKVMAAQNLRLAGQISSGNSAPCPSVLLPKLTLRDLALVLCPSSPAESTWC